MSCISLTIGRTNEGSLVCLRAGQRVWNDCAELGYMRVYIQNRVVNRLISCEDRDRNQSILKYEKQQLNVLYISPSASDRLWGGDADFPENAATRLCGD